MYEGRCLCGAVSYKISGEIKSVSNCYCTMCQKQHGAAFATYARVLKSDIHISGLANLATYESSEGIARKFCSRCGSNFIWENIHKHSEWTSIALGTLETEYRPENIKNIYTETKPCWLIND